MPPVTRVVGPIDPEGARWVAALNDPAAGRIAVVVPPGLPSLAALAGELLGALGKPADGNPLGAAGVETVELAIAWMRAHQIDEIVLVHADWVDSRVASDLCALAALVGAELTCIVGNATDDPFAAWTGEAQGWVDFVTGVTREEALRAAIAADPTRHQGDWVRLAGHPAGTHRVAAPPAPEGPEMAAYIDLAGRLRRDGRTEKAVARSLVLVLRRYPSGEVGAAAQGAATALAAAGWALCFDAVPEVGGAEVGAHWSDLRPPVHPDAAACLALFAAGLWAGDVTAVCRRDVALDGSAVVHGGRSFTIPAGARPYIVAQRQLGLTDDEPFLAHRGRPLSGTAAASAASVALRTLGLSLPVERLSRPRTPGLRWLAERGLVLARIEGATPSVRMARRCRHGLPGEFKVDGVLVGHSQSLCRAAEPSEVRPASRGFRLSEIERGPLGVRVAVSGSDGDAGELVGLRIGDGTVWVQVGSGAAPPIADVRRVVDAHYPWATGRSSE